MRQSVWDSRETAPRLPWFPPYGEGWGFADCPYPDCDYCRDPSSVEDDLDSVTVKKEDTEDELGGLSTMKPLGKKRPAATTREEEEEYGDFGSNVEELVQIMDSSPLRPGQQQQHRASMPAPVSQAQTSNNTTARQYQNPGTRTPNPQRTYDVSASMRTPTLQGNTAKASSAPGATKRVKISDTRGPPTPASTSRTLGRSLQSTPTGGRFTTATTAPGPGEDYEITTSILNLLANEKGVSHATREAIRGELNTYTLRMRGVERGRDITREALKAKDGKEAELKQRIEELEEERRVNAGKVRAPRDELGQLFDDADGGDTDQAQGKRS